MAGVPSFQLYGLPGWTNAPSNSYEYGIGTNSLANHLYKNADNIANSVLVDSKAIWEREDSAYQRMVADMKKAGLNPWTGISSGGLSTSSNNPSMDSLSSLIAVLGGLLDTENTFTRSSTNFRNTIYQALQTAIGAVSKMY